MLAGLLQLSQSLLHSCRVMALRVSIAHAIDNNRCLPVAIELAYSYDSHPEGTICLDHCPFSAVGLSVITSLGAARTSKLTYRCSTTVALLLSRAHHSKMAAILLHANDASLPD